jgi:hypothetical protein
MGCMGRIDGSMEVGAGTLRGISLEDEELAQGSRRGPLGLRGKGDPGSRGGYLGRVHYLIGGIVKGSNLLVFHRAKVNSRD